MSVAAAGHGLMPWPVTIWPRNHFAVMYQAPWLN